MTASFRARRKEGAPLSCKERGQGCPFQWAVELDFALSAGSASCGPGPSGVGVLQLRMARFNVATRVFASLRGQAQENPRPKHGPVANRCCDFRRGNGVGRTTQHVLLSRLKSTEGFKLEISGCGLFPCCGLQAGRKNADAFKDRNAPSVFGCLFGNIARSPKVMRNIGANCQMRVARRHAEARENTGAISIKVHR